MSKKKVHHEEHVDETWLLPYSDLLTLLLALFIVMFSISNVDKAKFQKMSEQFNVIFSGGSGVMQSTDTSAYSQDGKNAAITQTFNAASQEDDRMTEIKSIIESEAKREGYGGKVKVVLDKEGLAVTVQEVALFSSGDDKILDSAYPFLLQISKALNNMDNSIKIVGHTDNIPIHNSKFRSNWELSALRAINVMNYLVEQGALKPERFSIQGCGQYAPLYDNSTADGRAKNRRVEIFVTRKYHSSGEATK